MKMNKCTECAGDIVKKDKVFYQTYGNKKIRIDMTVDSCSLCDYTKVTKDMITEYNQKYQDAINKEKERKEH